MDKRMKCKYLIVPDFENLSRSAEIAESFGAAFEYDDFFSPGVYSSPEETEKRIRAYLSLGRDTSGDTLHGVFLDIAAGSADPLIRERSLELMEGSCRTAQRLGCRGVVFHTGIIAALRLPSYRQGWLDSMEPVYRNLCRKFPSLQLYLENSTEQEPELLVLMAKRLSDVPNFKLCLDYAHAALTPTPPEVWAGEMSPYLGHIHMNDNDGVSDLHLCPGDGVTDFARFNGIREKFFPQIPVLLELSGAEKSARALQFMAKDIKGSSKPSESDEISYSASMLMDVLDTTLDILRSKDKTALLNLILTKSMEIASCDAGTLYVLKDDGLHFMIMKTLSMGIDNGGNGEAIKLPPVRLQRSNVCAFSALEGKVVNIPDVYENTDFDFSGPKNYDKMTGYKTRSMLTVPLMDQNGTVLGVMQLLNAVSSEGKLCAFDPGLERIIEILAAQAAITMEQMNYVEEIRTLLWSFTSALAEAIDRRTPYNGSHTRKVAEYAGMAADMFNSCAGEEVFSPSRREQLIMAALLHDIGKIVIPGSVMNKKTRLGSREEIVREKSARMDAQIRAAQLSGEITPSESEALSLGLKEVSRLIEECSGAGFIPEDTLALLKEKMEFSFNGSPLLTEEEKKSMLVSKGTLTDDERSIMEGHVGQTESILSKVHFSQDFILAPVFAAQHHEFLNGSGYPRGLMGDEIPLESRIIAAADICDALLAADRPYKKALPAEKAFAVLRSMVQEGKLDGTVVEYLIKAIENSTPKKEINP